MSQEQGTIVSVVLVTAGSELVGDHALGLTVLTVDDAYDFDEDGGDLQIGAETYTYTDYDDDEGTLTLTGATTVDYEDGDRVTALPLAKVKVAMVELTGGGDAIEAHIPHALFASVPEGIREDDTAEAVTLSFDGDEYVVKNIDGQVPEFRIEGHPNADDEYGGVTIRTDELNGIIELTSDGAVAWSLSGGTGADEDAYVNGTTNFQSGLTTPNIQAWSDLNVYAGDDSSINLYGMGSWAQFIQAGTEPITPVANTPTSVDLVFPTAFDAAPTVVVTALTVVPGSTVTGVSVSDIDEIGCKLWINRTNNTVTYLHWIATRA